MGRASGGLRIIVLGIMGRMPLAGVIWQAMHYLGWRVLDGLALSLDLHRYRDYIHAAGGEFTVAREQYVQWRTGWFSDRSACYLAAGKPVITQDTGFDRILPTGEGLFAFTTMDDVLGAVDAVVCAYPRHARAARGIAREYFEAERVLDELLVGAGA